MKQFDVYTVAIDPTIGAEIKKVRPAVIISPDTMNLYLQTVIIAPMTHSIKQFPSRINTKFNGDKGQVVLDQIRAVDKSRLIKKLGKIAPATASDVKLVLATMFS